LKRVTFLLDWIPEYRVRFFEGLRCALAERDIELDVVYGSPDGEGAARGDVRRLPWGRFGASRRLRLGRKTLVLQDWRPAVGADLVVMSEGVRFLTNYFLLLRQATGGTKVALWGHGANLDAATRSAFAEYLKRFLYRWPSWWFTYTDGSQKRVLSTGFPANRTTVFYNSTSSETFAASIRSAAEQEVAVRSEFGLTGRRVGLFIGSLRAARRIAFLAHAADRIVEQVPDFVLVVAGDGKDREALEELARSRPHVVFTGRAEADVKLGLLRAAELMLLPAHVGLNLVDGFTAGKPTVTIDAARHGPEVEYLEDGVNGVVLGADATEQDFASAVVALLRDQARLRGLCEGATRTGKRFSEEAMIRRFADGIEAAIETRGAGFGFLRA
jgi:glycosyltransferase involved in cell wall biosynthesis